MHSTLQRIEEPRFDDDPHDAPIAPDVIPTAWVDRGPPRPANDATSRERLFAEIQSASRNGRRAGCRRHFPRHRRQRQSRTQGQQSSRAHVDQACVDGLHVRAGQRDRGGRLEASRRCGDADGGELGALVGRELIGASRNLLQRQSKPMRPLRRPQTRSPAMAAPVQTASTDGAGIGRRATDPVDGARSCRHGPANRRPQGQHRTAQGEPAGA